MRHLIAIGFLILALALGPVQRVHAWGFTGHKFIAERAIALLPPELKPFFDAFKVTIVEHSIDPDTYRTMGFTDEPPRHFVDMDAYGAFPFTNLPHDYNAAVARYGADFVTRNGLLPWRAQEIADRLAEAFKQTTPFARDDIKLFSAVLAHYIGDAHQPFHAAVNYDGQLTGQQGIHARFETELFERYQEKLRITPAPIVPIASVRDFCFTTLADSFQNVEPILAADRDATAGKNEYDDEYFARLWQKTQPILEKRVSGAITGVASVITAAWTQAGKPAVPVQAPPRAPRPIRRGA